MEQSQFKVFKDFKAPYEPWIFRGGATDLETADISYVSQTQ